MKPTSITASEASSIALNLIGFIVSDEERLERFLASSGLMLSDLKDGAAKPQFQGFVLEYALQDEKLILDFALQSGNKAEIIQTARYSLPGATYDF